MLDLRFVEAKLSQVEPKSGGGLMMRKVLRRIALFGAVAAMLSTAAIIMFSRATVSTGDLGTLKCYDVTGAIQKAC